MNTQAAAILIGLGLIVSACGGSTSPGKVAEVSPQQSLNGLRGDVLAPPTNEPVITMTDTSGARYNVEHRSGKRVTLVYFGYTHCPDICPLFMADLAAAIRQSPASVRRDILVVFVSVDPARDSRPVIRRWLDHFNPSFVGLRTSIRHVIAVQKALQIPVSKVNPHSKHGYVVQHSGELLAFTPDRKAHVVYTVGPSTISDLRHDLPILENTRRWRT